MWHHCCQLLHVIVIKIPFMYCRRFSPHGSHLVDALRHFLESFRLPGESPIIARILESFSEHWLVGIYYFCKGGWFLKDVDILNNKISHTGELHM